VYLAYRFFGLKGAGVALAVLGALAALRNARKGGYDARVREDTRIATDALDDAQRVRARVRKEIKDEAVAPTAPQPASRKRVQPKPDPYDRRTRRK
jgi:hypothetical protein